MATCNTQREREVNKSTSYDWNKASVQSRQFGLTLWKWFCFLRNVKLQTFSYKINHFPNIVPLTPWPISRVFVQEQRIRGTEIEMSREERRGVSRCASQNSNEYQRENYNVGWKNILNVFPDICVHCSASVWLTSGLNLTDINMYVDLIKHSLVARMCRVFRGNLKWCCQSSWLTAGLCRALGLVSRLDTEPGSWKTILITGTGTLDKIWFSSSLFSPWLKYFTLNTQDEIGWYISLQNPR